MNHSQIEQIARTHMLERKEQPEREPGWIFYHGLRTARIAGEICNLLNIETDRDVLFVGALFHDIGKGSESHHLKGAEVAKELLAEHCNEDDLTRICEIIRLHNQRNGSKDYSAAVRVVQDADLLDHVGPIGPWLSFYWSGTHSETVDDLMRFITGEENERRRNEMRSHLNFDASVSMFNERIRWEDSYFETFRKAYFEGVW